MNSQRTNTRARILHLPETRKPGLNAMIAFIFNLIGHPPLLDPIRLIVDFV